MRFCRLVAHWQRSIRLRLLTESRRRPRAEQDRRGGESRTTTPSDRFPPSRQIRASSACSVLAGTRVKAVACDDLELAPGQDGTRGSATRSSSGFCLAWRLSQNQRRGRLFVGLPQGDGFELNHLVREGPARAAWASLTRSAKTAIVKFVQAVWFVRQPPWKAIAAP